MAIWNNYTTGATFTAEFHQDPTTPAGPGATTLTSDNLTLVLVGHVVYDPDDKWDRGYTVVAVDGLTVILQPIIKDHMVAWKLTDQFGRSRKSSGLVRAASGKLAAQQMAGKLRSVYPDLTLDYCFDLR